MVKGLKDAEGFCRDRQANLQTVYFSILWSCLMLPIEEFTIFMHQIDYSFILCTLPELKSR